MVRSAQDSRTGPGDGPVFGSGLGADVEQTRDASPGREAGRAPSTDEPAAGDVLDELQEAAKRITEELGVLARVGADRARCEVRRQTHRALVYAAAAIALATWIVAGTWMLAGGFAGVLRETLPLGAGGARLVAGTLILALSAGALVLRRRMQDAKHLRRARERYEGRGAA